MIDAPRHACLGCGHCCTGAFVEVDADEARRIEALAPGLGVERPVVDGGLRFTDGHCVFLAEDNRCRLHAHHGAESKPHICRQYPFVAIETEDGPRAGIDPGCSTAWRTWRTGPRFVPDALRTSRRLLPPEQRGAERALLGAMAGDATVAGLLHLLCTGTRGGPELPPGFAGRWIGRVKEARLREFLARPDTGRGLREALAPLPETIAALDPAAPPPWRLPAQLDAWAVEVTRRTIFLRRAIGFPVVQGVALLTLGGAVLCGWASTSPERFGPAIAGWARIVRFRAIWGRLVPDAPSLAHLATGAARTQRPPRSWA